jgi:radical SAM protein with 4Fe4S-binding SPASM domain
MNIKYLIKEIKYYKRLGNGHVKRMTIKFLFAKTPLSKLVNSKPYSYIYSRLINKKAKKIRPSILQIETTNYCNARCVMCPHINMKRKQKTMSLDDFKKICLNVMRYEKIKLVVLSGFGEPLIDKGIIEKIKWLNKMYPKVDVDFYTNASLLTPKIVEELLTLKIHKINCSINGTENSYKKIMSLDYEKTRENILYFLKKKRQLRLKYPLVNISLMILKENKEDIHKVIEFWVDKSDSVMAYLPSDWAGKMKSVIINKDIFKNKRWPCKTLWTNLTVDVDGNVIMCCRDYESVIKFGNLLKKDIREIINSNNLQKLKKEHLNYNFSMPLCNNCDNYFDSSLDWSF